MLKAQLVDTLSVFKIANKDTQQIHLLGVFVEVITISLGLKNSM